MRLLVDCMPLSSGGGVQVAIAFLLNLTQQQELEWRAVLPTRLAEALPPDLASDPRVTYLEKKTRFDRLWLGQELKRLERTYAPDAVFTIFGPAYFRASAPHLMGFALPNLIYALPRTAPEKLGRAIADYLRARVFEQSDLIAVETETVRDRLAARIKFDKSKIVVIRNSVNPILLGYKAIELPRSEPYRVLVPSAYYRHKNLEIVPRVAADLRFRSGGPQFIIQLTLPENSEEWVRIYAMARRLGVADRLETLGKLTLDSLALAYQQCHAVLLPTLLEASTAVYPEAFHFRRPLVTSDRDFARELCGDAALFVDPHSSHEIGEALTRLARSEELVEKMCLAGDLQLRSSYPSASEKFRDQLAAILRVARMPQADGT